MFYLLFWHNFQFFLPSVVLKIYYASIIHQGLLLISTLAVEPLTLDYSDLVSEESPGIKATLNSLCAEPLDEFFVGILFGARKKGEEDCDFMQSKVVYFTNSRTVSISINTDVVAIPSHSATDYEYCAKGTLNDQAFIGKGLKLCNLLN